MDFKRGHEYPGYLFTFEGGEGAGKSTQIAQLAGYLREQGRDVLVRREPGGTDVGDEIRHVLLHSKKSGGMTPEAEVLLFQASRAQIVREVIVPALKEGKIVMLDRFYDSTRAYQGGGRGLNRDALEGLIKFATGDIRPDLTLLMDVDPIEGLERAVGRMIKYDRMEAEALNFHKLVREGFNQIAYSEPERVKKIDGAKTIEGIQQEVRRYVDAFIANPPVYKAN